MTTVQDLTLSTKDESASLICFMKYHVNLGARGVDFYDKIRHKKLSLTGGAFAAADMTPPKMVEYIQSQDGKPMMGVRLLDAESEVFPVNTELIFSNQSTKEVQPVSMRDHLCWVQVHTGVNQGIISVQLVFHATISVALRFDRFPFDRHIVPLEIALRGWRDKEGVSHVWILPKTIPEWAQHKQIKKYEEDDKLLTEKTRVGEDEFVHFSPVVLLGVGDKPEKPVLCVRLQRSARKFVLSVCLPIALFVMLALCAFFTRKEKGADKIELQLASVLTSSLTVTTFRTSVVTVDLPPNLNYLTLADGYLLLTFVFHLVLAVRSVALHICDGYDHSGCKFSLYALGEWMPDGDLLRMFDASLNSTDMLGTNSTEVSESSSHSIDIFLFLLWFIPHAVLIYSAYGGLRGAEDEHKKLLRFREPWNKKIRCVRQSLKFENAFIPFKNVTEMSELDNDTGLLHLNDDKPITLDGKDDQKANEPTWLVPGWLGVTRQRSKSISE